MGDMPPGGGGPPGNLGGGGPPICGLGTGNRLLLSIGVLGPLAPPGLGAGNLLAELSALLVGGGGGITLPPGVIRCLSMLF